MSRVCPPDSSLLYFFLAVVVVVGPTNDVVCVRVLLEDADYTIIEEALIEVDR